MSSGSGGSYVVVGGVSLLRWVRGEVYLLASSLKEQARVTDVKSGARGEIERLMSRLQLEYEKYTDITAAS